MAPKSNGPARAAKTAAAAAPMQAGGDSESWVAAKDNQRRILEQFLAHEATPSELRAKWGTHVDELAEEVACTPEIYAYFATFLCEHYVIEKGRRNAGKHLMVGPALSVWSGVLNQAAVKWSTKAQPEHKVPPRPAPPQHTQNDTSRARPGDLRPPSARARVLLTIAHCAPPLSAAGVLRVPEVRQHGVLGVVPRHQVQDDAHHQAQHGHGHADRLVRPPPLPR